MADSTTAVASAATATAAAAPSSSQRALKLALLSAGVLLGLCLLVAALAFTQPQQQLQQQIPFIAPRSAHLATSPSPAARHTLAAEPVTPVQALSRRKRHAPAAPAASSATLNSLDLLEADVLSAGGKPLGSEPIPCSFSFHPDFLADTALALAVEPSPDYNAPTSPLFNLLEWVFGVWLSYESRVNFVWVNPYAADKPLTFVNMWPRFLGLAQGEINQDDLNARYGEGGVSTTFVDHLESREAAVARVDANIAKLPLKAGVAGPVTRATAPAAIWWFRRPRQLDSHMVCHPKFARTMRQKYCAARAMRPVPFSLYNPSPPPIADDDSASTPLYAASSLLMPAPRSHPIHIAVQLHSMLDAHSGTSASSILSRLPGSWSEYMDSMSLVLMQILTAVRRHSKAQVHVHLFADPPLIQSQARNAEAPSALWGLEEHPQLRALIARDGVEGSNSGGGGEGMSLQSHYYVSSVHMLHHMVMSDLAVVGWNSQGLMSLVLGEGLVVAPWLGPPAEQDPAGHPNDIFQEHPDHFLFPACNQRTTFYKLRHNLPQEGPTIANTAAAAAATPAASEGEEEEDEATAIASSKAKQQQLFNAFFAEEGAAATETEPSTAADGASAALLPSRFELPLRRMVRRRNAEALVLSTFFSEPSASSPLFRPNPLLMRHCQAIPEPTNDAVMTNTYPDAVRAMAAAAAALGATRAATPAAAVSTV